MGNSRDTVKDESLKIICIYDQNCDDVKIVLQRVFEGFVKRELEYLPQE